MIPRNRRVFREEKNRARAGTSHVFPPVTFLPGARIALVGGLIMLLAVLFAGLPAADSLAQNPAIEAVDDEGGGNEDGGGNAVTREGENGEGDGFEDGLYLPSDRQRQRQLDRAIRLIDEKRWSDASMLLDEILAAENDSFHLDRRDRVAKVQNGGLQKAAPRQGGAGTWKSLKAVASELIESLDKEGREAYELQFRLRAERALEKAIADGDLDAAMAVARRWFHTPAGGKAAMLLALASLETGQPLASVAWLDRLHSSRHAAAFEPTLSVMRAIAYRRSGDLPRAVAVLEEARKSRRVEVRIAGRDLNVSYPSGGAEAWLAQADGASQPRSSLEASEWPMPGGNPSRNAVFDGSRPLLAPRYRVSLARHPEEARGFERHRATMAEQQIPLLPAGQPLAVQGRLFVHSALGLLAVDFETGKRVWMQSGPFGTPDDPLFMEESFGGDQQQRVDDRVFEDATAGTIASDGRLVFAVENPRQAYAFAELQAAFRNPQNPLQSGASNALSAYEVGGNGRLAWRLSGLGVAESIEPGSVERAHEGWFVGPPLPVAGQLFVMVEAKGGIRLDVLDSSSGKTIWSQPLAELDDGRAIDKPTGRERRFAGLTPSLAEGVLVCPTGAGAIVGVDLATRTLLWAYRYPSTTTETTAINGGVFVQAIGPGGMVIRRGPNGAVIMQGPGSSLPARSQWIDGTPILADGRVIVSPRESNELHCLDLRSGRLSWKRPRKQGLYVAGVVDGRAIVVGGRGVEAVSLATGEAAWKEPVTLKTASPCGRGCIVRGRLLLPTDAPEVIEIDLAAGGILGRSAGRGGQAGAAGGRNGASAGGKGILPGNLIAYRGEVISQTASSLDVYHQAEPLEKAVETALSRNADDPWALYWRGQAMLDRGKTSEGIASVQAAHAADPKRIPAGMVADTILFAMERDFPAASALWMQAAAVAVDAEARAAVLRVAVGGFLKARDPATAWQAFRRLVEEPPAADVPFVDPADNAVTPTGDRWLRGRLQEILAMSAGATPPSAELCREIEETTRLLLDRAVEAADPVAAIDRFIDRFDVVFPASPAGGRAPGGSEKLEQPGLAARRMLCERLAAAGGSAESDAARGVALGRDLLLLSMLRSEDAATRDLAARFVPAETRLKDVGGEGATADAVEADDPWPVGGVVVKREDRHARGMNGQPQRLARIVPVPCEPDIGATADGLSLPDLRLSYDVQNVNAVIASDGLGRRLGEPLTFENGLAIFGGMQASPIDATAVGRVVVLRNGGTVTAFELTTGGGRNRKLWSTSGSHGFVVGNFNGGNARVVIGNGMRRAGAAPRNGGMPLGMRLAEPAIETAGPVGVQIGRATTAGVPMIVNGSLELRDVLTGEVLWTRLGIPTACDLLGDERFLTVLPRDGKNAVVLSMVDGREVRRCDLPPREQRLCASGRRLVAIDQAAGTKNGAASLSLVASVGLAVFDPATGRREHLGDFPADARATMVGGEELAVLDGRGRMTLVRIADGKTIFSRTLDQMPGGLEGLHVLPWNDRLIVVAARRETTEEQQEIERLGAITGIPHAWGIEEATPVVTGSVWSLDRTSGESLWSMPASVLRHGLLLGQPTGLPVLVFARQVHSRRGDDRPKLGLLCLDKRTGHEIHADDRLPLDSNMLFTCEVSGDPAGHRMLLEVGSERISLTFDGSSISPRPPYQATGKSAGGKDVWGAIEQFMQQIIPFPAPGRP
jgi:outer membrane protein assembly factor BamB